MSFMKGRILPVLCCISLLGCGWDTDEEYIPSWESTWLVLEQQGLFSIVQVTAQEVFTHPSFPSISRLVQWNKCLWGTTSAGTLVQIDPRTAEIVKQISLPSGQAIEVGAGLSCITVCSDDSTLFLYDGEDEWRSLPLPGLPILIQGRSDRSFVVIDDSIVWKIQEQTLGLRDTFSFHRPVTKLQNDNGVHTYLSHADSSSLYLSRLNYHGQASRYYEVAQAATDIQFNPLLRAESGIEFLGNLEIKNGCLTAPSGICGDQFWPIWETGKILVQRSDSLILYDLHSARVLHNYGFFSGQIRDGENIIQ